MKSAGKAPACSVHGVLQCVSDRSARVGQRETRVVLLLSL